MQAAPTLAVLLFFCACGEVQAPPEPSFMFDPDAGMTPPPPPPPMQDVETPPMQDAGSTPPAQDAGTTPLPPPPPPMQDAGTPNPSACTLAQTQVCYMGDPSTQGVGLCRDGIQYCEGASPAWGECKGQVLPSAEDTLGCDGLDNDCDGMVDEGVSCNVCQTTRVQGSNRWETTVAASKMFYPNGANSAVVFALDSGDYPNPDGIVGGALAASLGGPALGTYRASVRTTLHPSIKAELQRLGVRKVYVVGGTAVISTTAESELRAAGYSVTRFAGANRADTAARVARQMGAPGRRAFVVNQGEGYAPLVDGAAVAGVAGKLGYPVLFTKANSLPAETTAALRDLGISRTYVVGGTAAISNSVYSQLPNPRRIAGADRYASSVAIADLALTLGIGGDKVVLVSGTKPLDAMAAASGGHIHLLVHDQAPYPSSVAGWLSTVRPAEAFILGGTAVIGQSVEDAFCATVAP